MSSRFYDAVDSDSFDEDPLFLVDTAIENSISFAESWNKYRSVFDFLRLHDYIPIRATSISEGVDQEELLHQSDIDGVTIEWKRLENGLKSEFRHFEVLPYEGRSIRRLYPIVKKHLDLSRFNADSFRVLKESTGTQLIYDGGWETWVGLIPDCRERVHYDFATQSREFCKFLSRVRIRFQDELKDMCMNGVASETFAKNNLDNAKRIFVLPSDQCVILRAFQTALDDTELRELPNFCIILLTFRFGEKCRSPLVLPIDDSTQIRKICAHIGHTISCEFADLFWARQGLQKVLGSKCNLSTTYSFFECANAQSGLDRSKLDVSADLRGVCTYPGNIQFVQLYSDLPHRYPKTRIHPVSGSVLMMEGMFTDVAQRNLYNDAASYISDIRNNFFQLRNSCCRLEFVLSVNEYAKSIDPTHFVNLKRLGQLLHLHPMIVPFSKAFGTVKNVREVGLHLTSVLETGFRTRRGTSDTRTVWEIYQTELAVEKLLWGRPLCTTSYLYSKNLGPGLQYPTRCLSDQRGFLCLEDSGSCCVDEETLPPLHLYSNNVNIQRQITSVSGLYQLIGGSHMVVGCRVINIFLRDCHVNGKVFFAFEQFRLLLKAENGNAKKRIVGGIRVSELVKTLSTANKVKWCYAFGAVRKLLVQMKVNLEEVLQYGITCLGLGYFPAVRSYTASHTEGLNWQYNYGYWVLTDVTDKESELERETAALQLEIVRELESRKLCYSSMYRDTVFPWIKTTLTKTKERLLSQDGKVKVLSFVSCVALLQLGKFIDYYALSNLEREMPISQSMLQMLEVQCRFQCPGVHNVKIYRLHPSVPFKLDRKSTLDEPQRKAIGPELSLQPMDTREPTREPVTEQIHEIEDGQATEVTVAPVSHVPSNKCYSKWSQTELGLLALVEDNCRLNQFEKYQAYQRKCRSLEIPDRSWISFKRKLSRIRAAETEEKK